MTGKHPCSGDESSFEHPVLPLAVEERLLAVCDEYEAAWKSAKRKQSPPPRIESFLADVTGEEYDWLLYELLRLDLHYRTEEMPTREELLARFPDSGSLIEEALSESLAVQTQIVGDATEDTAVDIDSGNGGSRLYCEECDRAVRAEEPEPGAYKCPECAHLFSVEKIGPYQRLNGKWHGAFGEVYKAYDPDLDMVVAIKVPKNWESWNADIKRRFYDEAKIAAHLSHEHIVHVTRVDHDDEGIPYIVSEFIDGRTLKDVLRDESTPNCRQAIEWTRQIAEALAHAHNHEKQVIHRDVKPANILIDRADRALLADFGLARQVDPDTINKRTVDGQIMGTPAYMPPEQACGRQREIDRRSDVYGLGAVLYELLSGRVPFEGDDVLRQIAEAMPTPPRELNPDVPRDLETICLTCLKKDPGERYQSAEALAADLQAHLDGESIRPPRFGPVSKAWRWSRKRPRRAACIAVLTLLLAVLAIRTGIRWKREADLIAQCRVHMESDDWREWLKAERYLKAHSTTYPNGWYAQEVRAWIEEFTSNMNSEFTMIDIGLLKDKSNSGFPDPENLAGAAVDKRKLFESHRDFLAHTLTHPRPEFRKSSAQALRSFGRTAGDDALAWLDEAIGEEPDSNIRAIMEDARKTIYNELRQP